VCRMLGTVLEQDSHSTYTVELFRPDDDKELIKMVHVHRIQPCHAKPTKDEAELSQRRAGVNAPEAILGHYGSTVEDLQLLVKWVDLSGEHNTLEPYSRFDLKGRRTSVGETAVAQKYLQERNVDPYKDVTVAPAAPLDPSHFQPDPLALFPTGDLPTVFAIGELVFSRKTNEYVRILQHTRQGTPQEFYSVQHENGFIESLTPVVLLHPSAVPDDVDIVPDIAWEPGPTPPTAVEKIDADAPAAAKPSKKKQLQQVQAPPLPTQLFKVGATVHHHQEIKSGIIQGDPTWHSYATSTGWIYPMRWDADSEDCQELERDLNVHPASSPARRPQRDKRPSVTLGTPKSAVVTHLTMIPATSPFLKATGALPTQATKKSVRFPEPN